VDPLAAGEAVRLGVVLVIHALRRLGQDHRDTRQLGGHAAEDLCPVMPLVAERAADVLAEGGDLAGQESGGHGVDLPGADVAVRQPRGVAVVPHDRGGRHSRHLDPDADQAPGVVAANRPDGSA
jgi:hypothetical protein